MAGNLRIDALVRELSDALAGGRADSARVNALSHDLTHALRCALHDALPIVARDLERCTLCHALTPVELLRSLPCANFVLLTVATENGGTTVCGCHALPDLLAGDDDPLEDSYDGEWAACPACQADFDAGRLHPISARSVANQAEVFDGIMTPELMQQAHRELLRLILDHRLPGDWLPYVPTTG